LKFFWKQKTRKIKNKFYKFYKNIKKYKNIKMAENIEKNEIFGSDEQSFSQPKIAIVGVGGGGCNSVRRLCNMGVKNADLIILNTDANHLRSIKEPNIKKILIGGSVTKGMGAGGFPDVGENSAISSNQEISSAISGVNLLFLTAGMGGGTGTGAAPVVAKIAKDAGAIVISIVTYPFNLERARIKKAKEGLKKLRKYSDTVIIIDNNKLVSYVPNLPIDAAFAVADTIISKAVKGITDTILEPSLINLDFADFSAVMKAGDIAMISVGSGSGPDKIKESVSSVLAQPLLDIDYKGATGALIHITGGDNLSLGDANAIGGMLTREMNDNANVIWGARVDSKMRDEIEVILIMTGVKSPLLDEATNENESDEKHKYSKPSQSPAPSVVQNPVKAPAEPAKDLKINKSGIIGDDSSFEKPKILVIGVGGAGNNSVTRLSRVGISGADLVAVNTDANVLEHMVVQKLTPIRKILIGKDATKGLGAGGFPNMGAKAAQESNAEIRDALGDSKLVFITAGMGGGTGTGAAPVIAKMAKEMGAIVISIVTFPFELERARVQKARDGIRELSRYSNTVVVIDNKKLVQFVPNLPIDKAFMVADEVIIRAVKGITETIMTPSLLNLDFADIQAVMSGDNDISLICVGDGSGASRVDDAVRSTLSHPLLDVSYKNTSGALIHICGGDSLTLGEVNEIAEKIAEGVKSTGKVIWGARIDPSLKDKVEVMAILTGIESKSIFGASKSPDTIYNPQYTSMIKSI